MNVIELVQNDTLPTLDFTIQKDGISYDLTGCTVYFSMQNENGTIKINKQTCTVVSASNGTCHYTLQSGDTNEAGQFSGEVTVIDGSGKIQTSYDNIPIIIRQEFA